MCAGGLAEGAKHQGSFRSFRIILKEHGKILSEMCNGRILSDFVQRWVDIANNYECLETKLAIIYIRDEFFYRQASGDLCTHLKVIASYYSAPPHIRELHTSTIE